jgi:hypothetical protein
MFGVNLKMASCGAGREGCGGCVRVRAGLGALGAGCAQLVGGLVR